MSRLSLWYLAPLLLALACSGGELTTPSRLAPGHGPSLDIADAAHGGTNNPHFYLLPPIVPAPTYTGTFDPTQSPAVEICPWINGACAGALIARYTMTTGPGSETVRLDLTNQLYIVNWHTDQFPLSATAVYRIRVLVLTTELGHADVQIFASQKAAKNDDTQQSVTLVDGTTLPIKFRIEQGAVYIVQPSQPATVTTPDGVVTLTLPPGALNAPLGLTVFPATLPTGTPSGKLVGGTAFQFGPDGTQFAQPVTLSLTYDATKVPAHRAQASLRLFTLVNGYWRLVPGSAVDSVAHTVKGPVQHFSTYAVQSMRRIVMNDDEDDLGNVPMVYEDGTDITNTIAPGTSPAWSPDGSQIATYCRGATQTRQICLTSLLTHATLRLAGLSGVDGSPPSWSPDGTKIVYVCANSVDAGSFGFRVAGSAICIVPTDGSASSAVVLDLSPFSAVTAQWSPDGTRIAFAADLTGRTQLYAMNPDGTNVAQIHSASAWGWDPVWSKDGTKLLYISFVGVLDPFARGGVASTSCGINILDLSTSAVSTVVTGLESHPDGEFDLALCALMPRWTPDGSQVTFTYVPDPQQVGAQYAANINPDGTDQTTLFLASFGQGANSLLDWEP